MTKLSLAYLTTEAHWQEKKNFIVAAEENSGSWKLKYLWTPWFRSQSVSPLLYKKRSLCENYTFIKQTLDFNTIILTKIFYLLRTHKIFSPLSVHICPLPSGGYFSIQHFFSKWKAFRHSITLKIKHLAPDSWFKSLSLEYCTFFFEVSQFLFTF